MIGLEFFIRIFKMEVKIKNLITDLITNFYSFILFSLNYYFRNNEKY